MDALFTTFLALALIGMGDRNQLLAAVLALRFGAGAGLWLGVTAATVLMAGSAAALALFLIPMMTPAPSLLFHALALAAAGAGMLGQGLIGRMAKLDTLKSWTTSAFTTGFLGLFIRQFTDKGQFVILAATVRTEAPVLTALGGFAGAMLPLALALLFQDRLGRLLPLARIRQAGGAALLLVAAAMAVSALGLL